MQQSDYEASECLASFCLFYFHIGLLRRTRRLVSFFLLMIFLLVQLTVLYLPVVALGQSMGRVVLAPFSLLRIFPALAELPPAINSSETKRYPQQHHHNHQKGYLPTFAQRRIGCALSQANHHQAKLHPYHHKSDNGENYSLSEAQIDPRSGLSHHPKELCSHRRTVAQLVTVPEQAYRHTVDHQFQIAHAGKVEAAPLKTVQIKVPPWVNPAQQAHLPSLLLRFTRYCPSSLQEQQHKKDSHAHQEQSTCDSVNSVHSRIMAKVPQMQRSKSSYSRQNTHNKAVDLWPQFACQSLQPIVLCAKGSILRQGYEDKQEEDSNDFSGHTANGPSAEAILHHLVQIWLLE